MRNIILKAAIFGSLTLVGCATESNRTIETESVVTKESHYSGPKHNLIVGKFDNRSRYGKGIFSDGSDKLGSQAKTILLTHLQQTGHFAVLDRANMEENAKEASLSGIKQNIQGARFTVTGNVTEFGRKTVGDKQLFGILGRGKSQVAYAKVMLNIVDVQTSAIVHSVKAAGEFALSSREIVGFGGSAGYDSTLNGKVLDLAIREAVNKLVADLEANRWSIK